MSRNGAGTYSLPAGNPVVNGTTITDTWANTTLSDIGSEMTNSIARDGQSPPTANLPMGGFRHTGAQDPVGAQDYVTKNFLTASGTAFGPTPLAASTAMKISTYQPELLLAKSNTILSAPADTTEDTILTVTIPAGAMGANGIIRIPNPYFSYVSTGVNLCTWRVRFDGTLIATYTTTQNTGGATTYGCFPDQIIIANRGATNSQFCSYTAGSLGSTAAGNAVLTAIDTTVAKNITFTIQKSVAGDTGSYQQISVLIIPST